MILDERLPASGPVVQNRYGPLDAAQTTPGYFAKLRFLGQLDLTYLVCEADGELVLVDQHAAHERVELARLLARHTARDVAIQRMLFPVTIDATPAQLALVERVRDVLAEVLRVHLGNPQTDAVFPGHTPRPVGFLA